MIAVDASALYNKEELNHLVLLNDLDLANQSTSAVYLKTGATNLNLGIALSIASVAGALIGSKTAVHLPQSAVMIILIYNTACCCSKTYYKRACCSCSFYWYI